MIQCTAITYHQKSRQLEVEFESGERFVLSAEFLRVHSPSAEVQGHHPAQRVLQSGKEAVNISAIHPVGQYAVLLEFDDGHSTGIYSFETLHRFGRTQAKMWADYLADLAAAGIMRKPIEL
jgi:DUF971 family protein